MVLELSYCHHYWKVLFSAICLQRNQKRNPWWVTNFRMEDLNSKKRIEFVFNIPDLTKASSAEHQFQKQLSEMMMEFIDFVAKYKNTGDTKAKILKLRDQAKQVILRRDEEKRKKELASKKYAEKIAKEKAIVNLSPQAQRKAEEKLRKEGAKKSRKIKKV